MKKFTPSKDGKPRRTVRLDMRFSEAQIKAMLDSYEAFYGAPDNADDAIRGFMRDAILEKLEEWFVAVATEETESETA